MAKILIVDDSKTSRKFLRNMLEQAGHEIVAEAVNGAEGVEKFRIYRPDITTMDITMPVLGGIDAVKDIIEIDPDAKIIMVTMEMELLRCDIQKLDLAEFLWR